MMAGRSGAYHIWERTRPTGRPTGRPRRVRGARFPGTAPKGPDVSAEGLISISTTANDAFGAFDWSTHAGKGVRLFVQGFG